MNFVYLFLVLFCCGCSTQNENPLRNDLEQWNATDKLKVLSTTGMIDDLVKQVGNGHVVPLTLIKGDLDPHSYQMVKGDDEKLTRADLIFYNGLGLEHGPSLQRHLHQHPHAISLGSNVRERFPQEIIVYHGQVDPHIWMDISLWQKSVPIIVEALSAKDPAHAETFRVNGERLMKEMEKAHHDMREQIDQISTNKRYLVSSHDAFNYFARAYLATAEERSKGGWQERVAAPEGLAPDSQLSSADIQLMIKFLMKNGVHIVFSESNVSQDSLKKIVSAGTEKGLQLKLAPKPLYSDAMGPTGSSEGTYLGMMRHNAHVITEALKGENNGK